MVQSPYVEKYYALRKFVKFPFTVSKKRTISPNQKAFITRYWEAAKAYGIAGKVQPGKYLFKSRSPGVLVAAKMAAGMEAGYPAFRVAIFDNVPENARIVARKRDGKNQFGVESKFRRERIFLFADYENYKGEFAKRPEKVAKRILRACKTAHTVRLMTGNWLSISSWRPDENLAREIVRFTRDYGSDRRSDENTFDKWFRGIVAIWFTNQKQRKTYFDLAASRKGRAKILDELNAIT